MRNLLQEFDSGVTILGFREHIFTGSVSNCCCCGRMWGERGLREGGRTLFIFGTIFQAASEFWASFSTRNDGLNHAILESLDEWFCDFLILPCDSYDACWLCNLFCLSRLRLFVCLFGCR